MYSYCKNLLFLLFALISISACGDYLEFSPYVTNLPEDQKNLTVKQLTRLAEKSQPVFSPFRFAVLADVHASLDEAKQAVELINNDPNIQFVLILGDITEQGLRQEYQWSFEIFSKLDVPFLTVIGNHDGLTNGKSIYRNMYGVFNYNFVFNDVLFVICNTNNWEFDGAIPDYDWIEQSLSDSQQYQHRLLASHVSPFFLERFSESQVQRAELLTNQYDVNGYIHGHDHDHLIRTFTKDDGTDIPLLTVGSPANQSYVVIDVQETDMQITQVKF